MNTTPSASMPFRLGILILCSITGAMYYASMFAILFYIFRLSHIVGFVFALIYVYASALPLYYLSQSIAEDGRSLSATTQRHVKLMLFALAPLPPTLSTSNAELETWRKILALVSSSALFSSAWASMAYGISLIFPHAYTQPAKISDWLMSKHYLWQLVDLVPGLDAWKAIHLEDPVKEASIWPGILVVLFRLIILSVIVRTAAKLWKLATHRETAKIA